MQVQTRIYKREKKMEKKNSYRLVSIRDGEEV